MTELAPPSQSAPPGSSSLTRNQLEHMLLEMLAEGPEKLGEQLQVVLTLSQQMEARTLPPAAAAPGLTLADAQIMALTNLAEYLSEAELIALYQATRRIEDVETRLLSRLRLALLLPPQHFQPILRLVWDQAADLTTPDARARVLLQLAPLLTLVHDEPTAPPILLEIVSLSQAIDGLEARIRALTALVPYLPQSMQTRMLHRIIDEVDRLHNDTQRATALTALTTQMSPEIEVRVLRSAESIQNPAERARVLTALAPVLPVGQQANLRRNTLNAISTVTDEEERAQALIAFAPYLEYVTDTDTFPPLLEQTLGIALSIKRRTHRAHVLVALAPHLTQDLQGEALAAVHGLSSERERALLLGELAPNLPANMLVASLAVAHSMQEQDARVQAFTALAHHAPEKARERTMLDALAAASNLPNRYERVSALMGLVEVLPPHLQARAYSDALETTRMIDNDSARARALSLLVPNLPQRLCDRALETARAIQNAEQRFSALVSIARGLPREQQHSLGDEFLRAIDEQPYEYKRARAVGEVADLLDDAHLQAVVNIARAIEDPMDRATALTRLIPHLPKGERQAVIIECWQLIREIDNGYDAASALSTLAPLLPSSAVNDLAHTAGMIIGSIMDEYDQASAVTILAPLLAAQQDHAEAGPLPDKHAALEEGISAALEVIDPGVRVGLLVQGAQLWVDICEGDQCYRLWQDVAQQLSTLPVAETSLSLSLLAPAIRHLAGDAGIAQLSRLLAREAALPVAESV